MANITAGMVKELRELSGAGMMDCKKALAECDGNMDEAMELLRKNGAAKAEKKAGRIAAEGLCSVHVDGNTASICEVNSETDFVAKNDIFKTFVDQVANQTFNTSATDVEGLMEDKWIDDSSKTVKEALTEQIAKIGENLTIRRFEKVTVGDNGHIVSYIHGGGRIAVLVCASCGSKDDSVKEALTNIAMQIAALNPKYIKEADIDAEFIEHEKEIIRAQIDNDPKESAKPDKVKEGMIQGRIKKELKEICLMDQVYVKAEDGKQNVAKYLEEVSKACGESLVIDKFIRFETGEGLEKKEENFAEEVAKQMGV